MSRACNDTGIVTADGPGQSVMAFRLEDAALFDTTAWTAPTLVGTTHYVRDRA